MQIWKIKAKSVFKIISSGFVFCNFLLFSLENKMLFTSVAYQYNDEQTIHSNTLKSISAFIDSPLLFFYFIQKNDDAIF